MRKKMKYFTLLLIILILKLNSGMFEESNKHLTIRVNFHDYTQQIKNGLPAMDRISITNDQIILRVEKKNLDLFDQVSLKYTILNIPNLNLPSKPKVIPNNYTNNLNGSYHNYSETQSFLTSLAEQFPERSDFFSLGQSIEERDIMVLKIGSKASIADNKPNIYITGCHHAREWISVEIPLLFAEYLLSNYSQNSEIKDLIDSTNIYIIPMINPDGLEFSIHTYRMWRKNRRYNENLTWGVDLNRNYEYQWGYDNIGSSPSPSSETYRGTEPFSEPETECIKDFMINHPPAGTLNFHNYSQYILFPWGYTSTPPADLEEFYYIASEMSRLIYQVNGREYQYGPGATTIYPTNGDSDDWVYAEFRTPSFTIELPPDDKGYSLGNFFTSEAEIKQTFNEMLPAMLFFCTYIGNGDFQISSPPPLLPGEKFIRREIFWQKFLDF